jgi:hypothetical protein
MSDDMLTDFDNGHFLLLASFSKHDFVRSVGHGFEPEARHGVERVIMKGRLVEFLHIDVHCLALLDRRQQVEIFLSPEEIHRHHYIFVDLRSQDEVCVFCYSEVVLLRNPFVEEG